MNETFKYQILFSYYKELLTTKQQRYLEHYYESNLSFTEIADLEKSSKEAVYDLIKRVNKKLDSIENRLKLYEKSIKIEKILIKEKIDIEIIEKIMEII